MRLAGTRMPRPPSSSSYGTFRVLRRVTTCPIVSGSRSDWSSRYVGFCSHMAEAITTPITRTNVTASVIS